MANVLAIDDDPDILALVKISLERDGHQVETCSSTHEASPRMLRFADLVLLDVMMPDEDGFAYCKRIRADVDCPILFVTARAEQDDLVAGLSLGADDYLEKPFAVAELRARVAAHLRRDARVRTNAVSVGAFRLDLSGKQVLYQGMVLPLTKREYLLCERLMQNAGQAFSKERLAEAIADGNSLPDSGAVAEHVKNIRAKIKPLEIEPIETVWGIGYRWRKENL